MRINKLGSLGFPASGAHMCFGATYDIYEPYFLASNANKLNIYRLKNKSSWAKYPYDVDLGNGGTIIKILDVHAGCHIVMLHNGKECHFFVITISSRKIRVARLINLGFLSSTSVCATGYYDSTKREHVIHLGFDPINQKRSLYRFVCSQAVKKGEKTVDGYNMPLIKDTFIPNMYKKFSRITLFDNTMPVFYNQCSDHALFLGAISKGNLDFGDTNTRILPPQLGAYDVIQINGKELLVASLKPSQLSSLTFFTLDITTVSGQYGAITTKSINPHRGQYGFIKLARLGPKNFLMMTDHTIEVFDVKTFRSLACHKTYNNMYARHNKQLLLHYGFGARSYVLCCDEFHTRISHYEISY